MTPLLNSAGKPLYVLRRISDKFVINPRAISNTTGLPNPGPDQEYLPILTDLAPDHDPVYTIRTQTEKANEATVPPQWEIQYKVIDRPLSERLAAADNAKRLEVQKWAPPPDLTESLIIGIAAILRDAKGLSLTPAEEVAKDKLVSQSAALTQNISNADDLKTAITLGEKPDLSSGWVPAPVSS